MSLFDDTTGELIEEGDCVRCRDERARFQAVKADLDLAEQELRHLRRQVAALKTELRNQREESPEGRKARALFNYWVQRCEKRSKLTKFGEKRQKVVIARLNNGYDATYIARAIDGLATSAWHRENGQDDLELVCRDEVHLERFHALAERLSADTLVGPAWRQEVEGDIPELEQETDF